MSWGKFWQISVKNKVYLILACTQIIQKVFLCMNIRYVMFILSKTIKKNCKYNNSLPIYDNFYAIFESKFWPKNISKIVYVILFWHILGKIQLVPKENLVQFVTLDIFKLCQIMYKNIPNLYLNALYPKLCQMARCM